MGRLLVEDYLMLFALSLFAAVSAVLLVYMEDIYTVYGVEKELASVRADFLDDLTRVLRADGLTIILASRSRDCSHQARVTKKRVAVFF